MTQDIKRKLTRQLLIDKGYELINMYGYHAVSIDLIIKEVSLTKGAFYYHFENKHHFVSRIIQERIEKEIHSEFIEPINKRGNPVFILGDLLQEKLINDDSLEQNQQPWGRLVALSFSLYIKGGIWRLWLALCPTPSRLLS